MSEAPRESPRVTHAVILLHGIRSDGQWMEKVKAIMQTDTLRVYPTKYGWFPALRFLFPWDTSGRPSRRVHNQYLAVKEAHPEASVSVIAHSFGTHVLTKTMERNPTMKLNRLILCGSVVKQDFQWGGIAGRIGEGTDKSQFIVNDCGNADKWPVLGASFGWWYGNAGSDGFGFAYVTDRFHDGNHGLFFDEAFVSANWTPFIVDGRIVQGTGEHGTSIPWWVRAIGRHSILAKVLAYSILAILCWLVALFAQWLLFGPIVDSIEFSEYSRQAAIARKQGEVELSIFGKEYTGHRITWDAVVTRKYPTEYAYTLVASTEDAQPEEAYAVFADPDEYQAALATGSRRRIVGTIQKVNELGTILQDCHWSDRERWWDRLWLW